jgi:hypothetical protein
MKCNVGKTDKTIRIIVGILLIAYGIAYNSWIGIIGLIPVLTALAGWCPVYIPFNINTSSKK